MKSILFKVILAVIGVAISVNASAYDFEVNGIYYNITDSNNKTCGVAPKNGEDLLGPDGSLMEKAPYNKDAYSGIVKIPEKVMYLTQEYTVKSIDYRAFINCSELIEVIIPNTVITIGEDAFWHCGKLKRLIIPKSVESIVCYRSEYIWYIRDYRYYGCFNGCNNIEEIIVEEGNPVYDSRDNCNAIIETSTNTLILGMATSLKIPRTVSDFGRCSINGNSGLRKLEIEDSANLLEINSIFSNCPIDSLYIGRPLQIENSAPFSSSLKYIEIGEYVKTMGSDNLFKGCVNIQSINCKSPTPPATNLLANELLYDSITLNIPIGSLEEYKSHPVWGRFKNIVEKYNIIHDTEHSILDDDFIYINSDSTCILVNTRKDSYNYGINRIYNNRIKGYKFVSVGDGIKPLNGTLSISLPSTIQNINDYSLNNITGGSDYSQVEKDYKIKIPIENELKYIGAYAFPTDPLDKFRLHINKYCNVNLYAFATEGTTINNRSNLTIDSENPYIGIDGGVIYFKDSEDVVRYFIHQTSTDTVNIPSRFTFIDNISTSSLLENIKFENASLVKYLRLKNCNITNDEDLSFDNIDTISTELFNNCKFNTKKLIFPNAKYVLNAFGGSYKHLVFENVETLEAKQLFAGSADTLSIYAIKVLEPRFIFNATIKRLNWLNDDIPFTESVEEPANRLRVLNLGNAKSVGRMGMMYAIRNRAMEILLSTTTPPTVSSMVLFNDYPYDVILYVPAGSGEAYRNHEKWGVIPNIIEYDVNGPDPTSAVNNIKSDKSQIEVDVYNLQGVRVRKGVKRSEATQGLPQGIYIINGEKVLVK